MECYKTPRIHGDISGQLPMIIIITIQIYQLNWDKIYDNYQIQMNFILLKKSVYTIVYQYFTNAKSFRAYFNTICRNGLKPWQNILYLIRCSTKSYCRNTESCRRGKDIFACNGVPD